MPLITLRQLNPCKLIKWNKRNDRLIHTEVTSFFKNFTPENGIQHTRCFIPGFKTK